MRILITGATGFIGQTLVPYLIGHGITEIALLVRDERTVKQTFPNSPLWLINITKSDWGERVIDYNPEIVLHLATFFTTRCNKENASELIRSNVLLTTLLLESLSHTGCCHFINIGTFTEFLYGGGQFFPNNLYSATKTAVRPIIQFYQTQSVWNWVNVIIYSPYGRKNGKKKVIDYMIDALNAPTPINFTKGEQILDFVHVDDVADFFYTLISKLPELGNSFYEFHLGTGNGHSLREIAFQIEQIWAKKINANWGGYPYNKFDAMYAVAPISQNIRLLGWRAKLSLSDGIRIFYEDLNQ